MPFIGNQPALSYTSFAKQDFTTSATTSYTLDNPVANENEIALFINFVRQEPTTAYTASGTSLTLTSATSASDDMYCVFLGKAVQTVNPPNGSVGISQLSATGTKDSTTFLRGDNTFAAAGLNGWSEDGANNNLLPASASAGIYLGVNSATASNLLDDYEEGSHTVTTNAGLTLSLNDFNYTKIGNFVILSGKATVSTTDGSSTQVTMSLPFTSSGRTAVTVNFVSGQNTGDIGLVAYTNSSNNLQFYNVNDNSNESNHTNADLSGGDEYYFTVTYRSA
jgi:hypothetical protein